VHRQNNGCCFRVRVRRPPGWLSLASVADLFWIDRRGMTYPMWLWLRRSMGTVVGPYPVAVASAVGDQLCSPDGDTCMHATPTPGRSAMIRLPSRITSREEMRSFSLMRVGGRGWMRPSSYPDFAADLHMFCYILYDRPRQ
jgi:hypothetical protein